MTSESDKSFCHPWHQNLWHNLDLKNRRHAGKQTDILTHAKRQASRQSRLTDRDYSQLKPTRWTWPKCLFCFLDISWSLTSQKQWLYHYFQHCNKTTNDVNNIFKKKTKKIIICTSTHSSNMCYMCILMTGKNSKFTMFSQAVQSVYANIIHIYLEVHVYNSLFVCGLRVSVCIHNERWTESNELHYFSQLIIKIKVWNYTIRICNVSILCTKCHHTPKNEITAPIG